MPEVGIVSPVITGALAATTEGAVECQVLR